MQTRLLPMAACRPVTAALGLLCALAVHANDRYDYATNLLQAPAVVIGNATYLNMVLQGAGLDGAPGGGVPQGALDSYDPVTGDLSIPAVDVYRGGTYLGTVYNVRSRVTFVSAAGVSGADTVNSQGTINIPFLHVKDGAIDYGVFTNVQVAHGSLSDPPVVSPGGGIPGAEDVWDLGTQRLTIAAIDLPLLGVRTNPVLDMSFTGSAGFTSLAGVGQAAAQAGVPALYVIDGHAVLHVFDADGVSLASAALPVAGISNINGGGITTDASNLYVTIGEPLN